MSGTLRAVLAELLGTFFLVLAAAGTAAAALPAPSGALAYGLAATAALFAFGQGAPVYCNPALTAAAWLTRRFDGVRAALTLAAQLLGAALAGLYLQSLFGPERLGSCVLSGVGFRTATLAEALGTFLIATAYFTGSADPRRGWAPLAAGAATTAAALVFAPVTGGAFNPARAFGPAVASGQWAFWYVWWIGPLAGAVPSALLVEGVLSDAGARKAAKDKNL